MPPFPQNSNPTPSFPNQKPPQPKFEDPKGSGLDQQTRNTVMFAVIFSVLAAGVLLFIFLKPNSPSEKNITPTASSTVTTIPTDAATTTIPAKKSIWQSLFSFLTSPQYGPTKKKTTMFSVNTNPKTTTTSTSTKTTATTTVKRTTKVTTSTATTSVPTKQLVGIYSELPSAELQLDLEFFKIDLPSSPLRGNIWISSVKRSTDATKEYVILSTKKELPSGTKITGMTLKSVVSGQVVQIGKGVGLPQTNDVNSVTDILIEPGQKILINTSTSPLGYSFRLNKCIGYFEQYQNFTPGLPKECPLLKTYPRPAPPNQLQDPCIDYTERFPRCTIVTSIPKTYADKLNDEQKYRCLAFIQDYTGYQNCVELHMHDTDFLDSEWRTYLSRSTSIWKTKREVIWLIDQEGRFVSQYSY